MDKPIPNRCERCGRNLRPEQEALLIRNWKTNTYHVSDDEVPADEGGFVFGKDCAAAVLKNAGIMRRIAPHPMAGRQG